MEQHIKPTIVTFLALTAQVLVALKTTNKKNKEKFERI